MANVTRYKTSKGEAHPKMLVFSVFLDCDGGVEVEPVRGERFEFLRPDVEFGVVLIPPLVLEARAGEKVNAGLVPGIDL